MNLPPLLQKRILYILYHIPQLRAGTLQADARWLTCVEETIQQIPSEEKRRFFNAYFILGQQPDEILFDLYIEHSTLYAWRRELLWQTALNAARLGLILTME